MRRFSFWCRARLVPSDRRLSLVSLEFVPRIPTYFRLLPVFSFSVVGYTCELNQRGSVICPRQGAAVDLIYPGKNSYQVVLWLAQHTPFDRLYLYGPERPLHISYGPEQNRALVELTTHHGRRMPKRLTLTQLKGMC